MISVASVCGTETNLADLTGRLHSRPCEGCGIMSTEGGYPDLSLAYGKGVNMMFEQYNVVKIKSFSANVDVGPSEFDQRPPRIGDIATILEVYTDPPGYELECSDPNNFGTTIWMRAFGLNELELELVLR